MIDPCQKHYASAIDLDHSTQLLVMMCGDTHLGVLFCGHKQRLRTLRRRVVTDM
jgi:hypothetical protein